MGRKAFSLILKYYFENTEINKFFKQVVQEIIQDNIDFNKISIEQA